MSNNFLSGGGSVDGLTDGDADINVFSVKVTNLTPNRPVKTDGSKQLVSSLLSIDDVSTLAESLATKSKLDYNNVIPPAPPAAGKVTVFAKADRMYQLDSNGVETELGGGFDQSLNTTDAVQFTDVTLTGGASPELNIKGQVAGPNNRGDIKFTDNGDITTQIIQSAGGNLEIKNNNAGNEIIFKNNNEANQMIMGDNSTQLLSDDPILNLKTTTVGTTRGGVVFQDSSENEAASLKLNAGYLSLRNNTVGGALTLLNNNHQIIVGQNTLTGIGTQSLSLLNTTSTDPTDINMTKLGGGSAVIGEILSNVQTLGKGDASTPTVGRIRSTATENFVAGANGSEMTIATVKNGETALTDCATFSEGGITTDIVRLSNTGTIEADETLALNKIHSTVWYNSPPTQRH